MTRFLSNLRVRIIFETTNYLFDFLLEAFKINIQLKKYLKFKLYHLEPITDQNANWNWKQ